MFNKPKTKQILVILFTVMLIIPKSVFAVDSATLKKQVEEANKVLDELSIEVAQKGEALNDTKYELEVTSQQINELQNDIDEKRQKIDEGSELISRRIALDYKSGGTSFLKLFFNADSFDELINNIYYIERANRKDHQLIEEINRMTQELEKSKSDKEQKVENLKVLKQNQIKELNEVKKAEAKKAEYVDSLNNELKEQLEKEKQAEIKRQKELAERAAKKAAEQATNKANGQKNSSSTSSNKSGTNTISNASGGRLAVLNAAKSQLGVPYIFGAYAPGSALDCSGFTKYCYAQAGVALPHSAYGQKSVLKSVSVSNMQPGDLIFWIGNANSGSGNHVAIYAGNGMIYHANGSRVVYDSLRGGYCAAGTAF